MNQKPKTLAELAATVGMTKEQFAAELARELPAFLRTLSQIWETLPEAAKEHFRDPNIKI